MKWKNLPMPKELIIEEHSLSPTYGRFILEPLERGFGTTIGNSLRRVLMSSLQGAAVIGVRIDGVQHEFSTVPGVLEDVSEIVLNLKQLNVELVSDGPETLVIDVAGPKTVTAADIQEHEDVRVANPELEIATLEEEGKLKLEIIVDGGRGYVTAEELENIEQAPGVIPMDATFSPVKRVAYDVENTRVGQRTDYDKLTMEVWTNGTVSPDDAVAFAAKILKDHLLVLMTFEEEPEEEEEEIIDEEEQRLIDLLQHSVEELELSVRSRNCLQAAEIRTLGDLVQKTEAEMLKYRNFGRKSLQELASILAEMGLSFGMEVPEGYKKAMEEKQQEEAEEDEGLSEQEETVEATS
jgi:DNA-directed RNA polymerase subunit alpha